MKSVRVGWSYLSSDYGEHVRVLAIEHRGRDYCRCQIQRQNGEVTSNYPSYLLSRAAMSPEEKALRQREHAKRYRAAHAEEYRAKNRQYLAKNAEKRNAKARLRYLERREERLAECARWRAENPERVREIKRRHLEANRESILARERQRHAANPEKRRAQARAAYYRNRESALALKRLRRYGLTQEQLDRMLADQGGACAGCRVLFARKPHIDHDHVTGRVRGLLCFNCNAAIGQAGESSERLRALADYLDSPVTRKTVAA